MNKRQLKKLSKIAMQAVVSYCNFINVEDIFYDDANGWSYCWSDGWGDNDEASCIKELFHQFDNELLGVSISLIVNNEYNNHLILYPIGFNSWNKAKKIHFMANYLNGGK